MSANYLTEPLIFLIDSLFSLYITAVLLRFLLQRSGVSSYNPIWQTLVKVTHPPLKLLRRFIPAMGKTDTASLVLLLVLQLIDVFSILALQGMWVSVGALLILALGQLINLLLNTLVFAIFARALLSWFQTGNLQAVNTLLFHLTEPVLKRCRQFIPDIAGLDLSPLAALLLLQLAKMILLPPLNTLAGFLS